MTRRNGFLDWLAELIEDLDQTKLGHRFFRNLEFYMEKVRNWMDKETDHGDCTTKVAPKPEKNAEWRCPHGVLFRAQKNFGSAGLKWVPRKEEE